MKNLLKQTSPFMQECLPARQVSVSRAGVHDNICLELDNLSKSTIYSYGSPEQCFHTCIHPALYGITWPAEIHCQHIVVNIIYMQEHKSLYEF